jgi:hypothetical protein
MTTGFSPEGRRLRKTVSGQSKAEVQDTLKNLRKDLAAGLAKAAPVEQPR